MEDCNGHFIIISFVSSSFSTKKKTSVGRFFVSKSNLFKEVCVILTDTNDTLVKIIPKFTPIESPSMPNAKKNFILFPALDSENLVNYTVCVFKFSKGL